MMYDRQNIFSIIDAVKSENLIYKLAEYNPEFLYLYQNMPDEDIKEIGPYIFEQSTNYEFYKILLNFGLGENWGIHCTTLISTPLLVKHFQQFLYHKDNDGYDYYFRFYDPRVLREFLNYWDSIQLKQFFGPIEHFICEDEDPSFGLVFSFENNKLQTKRIPKEEIFPGEGSEIKKSGRKFFT